MLLINFAFFCIALSDAARLDESEKRPSEALWTKLKAYQNATGISNDETMRIWESTKEFAQKSIIIYHFNPYRRIPETKSRLALKFLY